MGVNWFEKDQLLPALTAQLEGADVVLDIGCGIRPQQLVKPRVHICCEPFGQYVEVLQQKCRNQPELSWVILQATLTEAVKMFPPQSVDTVFLVDVIEHLPKDEALQALAALEPIARRQLVLFTPLGFMPQSHPDGKDAWGLDGGAWQEHKSGWQPEDFGDGWSVLAAKVYHTTDNAGNVLAQPFGALWAIRNATAWTGGTLARGAGMTTREKVHAGVDRVLDLLHRIKS
jgi:hypothetical protein